jgi:transposase
MGTYYIGMDVHSKSTDVAVEAKGKIVARYAVPTNVRAIRSLLEGHGGDKHVAMEEGPMAGWLFRNLKDHVSSFTVCDPRRNKLISADGDKADTVDAQKLAGLLRGKFLRAVHHTEEKGREEFKRWVSLYQERVKQATRNINQLRAEAIMEGIRIPSRAFKNADFRSQWLKDMKSRVLASRLELLWIGQDATSEQARLARRRMQKESRKYPVIKLWQDVPGIGLIRACVLLAYLDTPWRFSQKNKLWKYCGVGLTRDSSGRDANGRPKGGKLRLACFSNKRLKDVLMGAATSAMRWKSNVFNAYYERMLANGMTAAKARHSVARKMATVLWGMWKSHSRFDAALC